MKKKLAKSWSENVTYRDNTSSLWKKKILDFKKTKSTFRGYGLNTQYSNEKVILYKKVRKIGKFITTPVSLLGKGAQFIRMQFEKLMSFCIFGNVEVPARLNLNSVSLGEYDPLLKSSFVEELNSKGIYLSHNGLKAFAYLRFLNMHSNKVEEIENSSVLEIGAGFFDFGYLLTRNATSFRYTIIDLPSMIASAVAHIEDFYDDINIYLPDEVEKFKEAGPGRHLLFLSPDQFGEITWSFDLFVNHESFSEMPIKTVNDYLRKIPHYMNANSTIFLVNRLARIQTDEASERKKIKSLEDITCFHDYRLSSFKTEVLEVESFRQSIKNQNLHPNIVYIGTT